MLTEIEWWGGLLFLWLAFSFWALFIATQWSRIGFQYLYSAASVGFSGVVLALYFYPLQGVTSQYVFLASFGLATVTTLLLIFWPESDDATVIDDGTDDAEEEEGGELLGTIVLVCPMVISLCLGASRVLQVSRDLGLLSA